MATTASLELINPYAKFGLKRRPTYEEIANLIGENEQLTGKLPNRDATFFKSSPQGSFFDGSDHLELLKDQQMRILDRQMREIMMRQEAHGNGHTYALHRRNMEAEAPPPPEQQTEPMVQRDTESMQEASLTAQLNEMARKDAEAKQKRNQAFANVLAKGSEALINTLGSSKFYTKKIQDIARSSTDTGVEAEQEAEVVEAEQEAEVVEKAEEEKRTVSNLSPVDAKIYDRLKERHSDETWDVIKPALEILTSVKHRTPREFANNTSEMSNVVRSMYDLGLVSEREFDGYFKIIQLLDNAKGKDRKDAIRVDLGKYYGNVIYYRYIAKQAQVEGARSKSQAKPPSRASGSSGYP